MEDINDYIDSIRTNNNNTYLNYIKEDCKDEKSIQIINDIISYNTFSSTKNIQFDKTSKKNKVEEYIYKRPWNKLHKIQKKNRLEIFLNKYLLKSSNSNSSCL